MEGMRWSGTGSLDVRYFLRVRFDDLWLPVQKSSISVRQCSARCWHPARAATGYAQNGGNLNQLSNPLQVTRTTGRRRLVKFQTVSVMYIPDTYYEFIKVNIIASCHSIHNALLK